VYANADVVNFEEWKLGEVVSKAYRYFIVRLRPQKSMVGKSNSTITILSPSQFTTVETVARI
jgi:hypothetical protein